MIIANNNLNHGLISQNHDVINQVNNRYAGKKMTVTKGEESDNTLIMSQDKSNKMHQKAQDKSITLCVDSDEIINNIYSETKDNITYDVNGVKFTNKEMKACKEIVRNAISALPTRGSDLDYKDYASMGIASNMVNSYAKDNLTDEQAAVIDKTVQEYLDRLVQAENERYQNSTYSVEINASGDSAELNLYYNRHKKLNQQAAESLKNQIANLPSQTRETLLANLESATEKGSAVQSASNRQLASNVRKLFETVDMRDEDSVQNVLKKYQTLVTPAYRAYGLEDTFQSRSLTDVLKRNVQEFTKQIKNANAVIDNVGITCNFKI